MCYTQNCWTMKDKIMKDYIPGQEAGYNNIEDTFMRDNKGPSKDIK